LKSFPTISRDLADCCKKRNSVLHVLAFFISALRRTLALSAQATTGVSNMASTRAIPSYHDALQQLLQQLATMLPPDKLGVFNDDAQRLGQTYAAPLTLKAGDTAPAFSLPNASGRAVTLSGLLESGPVILTFYRGAWCPYCNLQLRKYQEILPQISAAGAQLVAVSPMTPDHSLHMKTANELQFEVLSDVGNNVARQFTTVITNPASSIASMAELGYDFYSFYGDRTAELPVPATFMIATNRCITFAASEGGDYRERVEPKAILTAMGG
jgi:peroxiredoxin